ncbi:MAG: GNAT family N-acetyltransferase [Clostridia bacterium]|nr:GNAT family N-acetyltransferase [Clostridia bacterium]
MITLRHIGKSADDLRFFILSAGNHAGGITVHSVNGDSFSYGIAVSPHMQKKGIAKAALLLLFEQMKKRGFESVIAEIAPENIASIALHQSLGFERALQDSQHIVMKKAL